MQFLKTSLVVVSLLSAFALPSFAEEAAAAPGDPSGTFVDSFGTSFTFSLCGENKQDLCGTLDTLKGASATDENLAFVGKQVMQATMTGPGQWKGSITAGGLSADANVTMTSANTIDIQGCRSILCQTLTYTRS